MLFLGLVNIDYNMIFSYSYCQWQNQQWQTNAPSQPAVLMATVVRRSNTDGIVWWSMSTATLEVTGCRHRATTCSVRPSGHQGDNQQNNNQTIHPLCWPIWWPSQCSGTIPHISPNRDGSGLQWKPLVPTIGQVLRPIVGVETKKHRFLPSFFIVTHYKRDRGDVMDPNNNRGMTYQSNEKELGNTMQYLIGGVNIAE